MSDPKDAKGQPEPSMEEILASIRRIIAEDGEQAPAAEKPASTPRLEPVGNLREEILELTEVVEEEGAAAKLDPEPAAAASADEHLLLSPEQRLVSEEAAAASIAALSQLHQLGGRDEQSNLSMGNGQRTIEELVREMLRPLLKEWLDGNLPRLVERVVREEVDRMVRDVRTR